MMVPKKILPIIIISQFYCTSLWFAGNAVSANLISDFGLNSDSLGHLTSAVQFGFIAGTLLFAIFSIADRFSPSKVFFACAVLGSIINVGIVWGGNNLLSLVLIRFATGFCLAGVYPVGMKIAADYFDKGLGKTLGFLVGALVLGTAFPHFLKTFTDGLPWIYVMFATSSIAFLGGLLVFIFIPDGPFRKTAQKTKTSAFLNVFKNKKFRRSAFGYFGHMWELYTFWTFVPFIIGHFNQNYNSNISISFYSFLIIAIGIISCVVAGFLAHKHGARKIARTTLFISGVCCLLSPMIGILHSTYFLMSLLLIWGITVIPDSPLFSTLVAQNAPSENKGTALTIVNCIGFSITIISIQITSYLLKNINPNHVFVLLAIGPVFGLISTRLRTTPERTKTV